MKNEQPEALRLADWFDSWNTVVHGQAANELRRLHGLNEELLSALNAMLTHTGMNDDVSALQCSANARLIAAAPDLLAALQVMLRDYAAVYLNGDLEMQPSLYQASAAIAKAERRA